jgi:hypothetical protein
MCRPSELLRGMRTKGTTSPERKGKRKRRGGGGRKRGKERGKERGMEGDGESLGGNEGGREKEGGREGGREPRREAGANWQKVMFHFPMQPKPWDIQQMPVISQVLARLHVDELNPEPTPKPDACERTRREYGHQQHTASPYV